MTLSSTKHTGQAASCLNAREVNQPPQPPSPLIVGTCPGLSLYPFWDEGLAGKALSARPTSLRLDPTSLWRRNHPSGIPTPSGIPPEFVKRAYAADCVLVRVQVAVWLGIVWVPPSGVRHSQATADRLTDRGLVPSLKGIIPLTIMISIMREFGLDGTCKHHRLCLRLLLRLGQEGL
eukprot:8507355-Pyramimonas_sp.AAC.1